MNFDRTHRRHALAIAICCAVSGAALAQSTVTVTGRTDPSLAIGGFGQPLSRSPLQASVLGSALLGEAGIDSLAGITKLDASIADAYNSQGYWSGLTVRGFIVDARSNYRRDGLPINAETSLSLVNKDRVEVLKGTSGIQAGTSAPGGLVNLVVKRPTTTLREIEVDWVGRGSLGVRLDLSQRFGNDRQFGARVNAELAELRPETRSLDGQRGLFALALDWLPTADSRLEFEAESSRQSQPSQAGFSLLGDRLPDARTIDPRINLNNQPWGQPVVLDGDTASLRWQQRLTSDWSLTLHAARQQLRSDDRMAFPYGCSNQADTYYADRYCPDGSFDLYDFRSDNERRRSDALDTQVQGRFSAGGLRHDLTAGVLLSRTRDRFQRQAYNYVGAGSLAADTFTEPDPALTDENTQRDGRSRELYLRDTLQLNDRWQLWTGLRHSRIQRDSVRTDGSRPTSSRQSFTVPWLALGFTPASGMLVYASWGQGVESEVVPNRSLYSNRGQTLPALKSRQTEAGFKFSDNDRDASFTLFDIERPAANDFCNAEGDACERRIDGIARHRGVELAAGWRVGSWGLRGSALWLQARRQGSQDSSLNGQWPTNVPDRALKLQLSHDITSQLKLVTDLVNEGRRAVLPDNSIKLGSWTRIDAALSWQLPTGGYDTRLRVGVDNLGDRRAWRESPYQFGHVYLMPMAPRTWRAAFSTRF